MLSNVTNKYHGQLHGDLSADDGNGNAEDRAIVSASEAYQTISTILNAAGEIQVHNPECKEVMQICRATLHLSGLIGAICETREFDQQTVPMDHESLDLIDFLKSSMDRFSRNFGVDFDFFVNCDASVIPKVNVDRTMLGLVLDLLFDEIANPSGISPVIGVEIERLARSIRISISGDEEIPIPPAKAVNPNSVDGKLERTQDIEKLVSLLHAKINRSVIREDCKTIELKIPINAGISLPDPSTLAADLIHIPGVPKQNAGENPIPRAQKTG